ncbi:MAG: ZIP family metal transporter [Chitinivibrionia bacterium]|nr:ZIP family metal transporter [Chitinivibrionia bacterium]
MTNDILQIVLLSAITGICGMGLGGVVAAILLKKPSDKIICWLLSFSAGVMVSVVCFGLVPEALELADTTVSIFGLALGIVIVMGLNRIVDKITIKRKEKLNIHTTYEEMYHESRLIKNPTRLLRSGLIILLAMSFHNIPEGMAIGAGGSHNFQLGLLLALMIMFHNIPEGMAVAAPLLAGGIGKWKVIFLTALSGATTLLGGILGIFIGGISDIAVALSLSAAGGAMLYIVFGEIIPQSAIMTKSRMTSVLTLFGIIVGLIIAQLPV